MSTVEESIEVNVPLSTAYNQWTQFEEFPRFMEGVEEIRQIDDTHVHWRTKIAGITREFDAEVTEQRPDERIAWRSTSGTSHAGVVTFHRLDDERTRLMVQIDDEPEGLVEKAGDALGILRRRVKGDLERFKALIEERGTETGAWRGEVERPDERGQGTTGGRFAAPGEAGAPLTEEGTTTGVSAGTPGETHDPAVGGPDPSPRREQPGL